MRNLHRLSVFVAVAESASFSKAARRLRVSQPAVSRQIKDLESAVGAPLFDRTGRRVALTEAGSKLLWHAKLVRESVEAMEMDMESIDGGLSGLLQLGASTVWEYQLPGIMGAFSQDHSRLTLSLAIGNSRHIVERLLERDIHLGFVGDEPHIPKIEATSMGKDELVIVAPAAHPLARKSLVAPSALRGVPFVHREADSATAQISRRYLDGMGIKTQTVMEMGSHEAVKLAVQTGVGLGMLSKFAVQQELRSGALRQVRLRAPPCTRPLYWLRNTTRPFSVVQQAFVRYVTHALR